MTQCTFCGEKYDRDPVDGRCVLCRNRTTRATIIADKVNQTDEQIRDLRADLAICDAATPGPWDSADTTDGFYILDADDYVLAATLERAVDATFILESRQGWPEAIRRAIAAEAEVERLLAALREIDDHIKGTHEPTPYIAETLRQTLPEYTEHAPLFEEEEAFNQ